MAVRSQMCGADPGQVCSSMSAARNVGETTYLASNCFSSVDGVFKYSFTG